MGTRGRPRVPPPGLSLSRSVECLRQAPGRDGNKGMEVGQKVTPLPLGCQGEVASLGCLSVTYE